jgi:hypothetical protein
MADAEHSKCFARKGVRVQVPHPAQKFDLYDVCTVRLRFASQVVEIVVQIIVVVEFVVIVVIEIFV